MEKLAHRIANGSRNVSVSVRQNNDSSITVVFAMPRHMNDASAWKRAINNDAIEIVATAMKIVVSHENNKPVAYKITKILADCTVTCTVEITDHYFDGYGIVFTDGADGVNVVASRNTRMARLFANTRRGSVLVRNTSNAFIASGLGLLAMIYLLSSWGEWVICV